MDRRELNVRYGLLKDRIALELKIGKKEAHTLIKRFKGIGSVKELSEKEMWELMHELIAFLAEYGVEFYFGDDYSDNTLKELHERNGTI